MLPLTKISVSPSSQIASTGHRKLWKMFGLPVVINSMIFLMLYPEFNPMMKPYELN